jgi:hypothetical protein
MSYPLAYKPNGIGDCGGFLVCGENDLWKGRRPYGRRAHFDLDRGHRKAVDLASPPAAGTGNRRRILPHRLWPGVRARSTEGGNRPRTTVSPGSKDPFMEGAEWWPPCKSLQEEDSRCVRSSGTL